MARKVKHPEHVNHERWLVSYADFITLLFATFTMLFAISNADKEKWAQAAKSLTTAFEQGPSAVMAPHVEIDTGDNKGSVIFTIFPSPGAGPKSGKGQSDAEVIDPMAQMPVIKSNRRDRRAPVREASPAAQGPVTQGPAAQTPAAQGPAAQTPAAARTPGAAPSATQTPVPTPAPAPQLGKAEGGGNEALAAEIKELLDTAGLAGKVDVREEQRGMVISLGEAAFFAPGEIEVLPHSRFQLDKIINALRNKTFQIRIEGHTDDTPITSGKFRSNSELSCMRATRIMDFMIKEYRFPADLLSAAGYGEYRPVVKNDTLENKQKNRRVDIVILNEASKKNEPR